MPAVVATVPTMESSVPQILPLPLLPPTVDAKRAWLSSPTNEGAGPALIAAG
jgi:hypothetical protein